MGFRKKGIIFQSGQTSYLCQSGLNLDANMYMIFHWHMIALYMADDQKQNLVNHPCGKYLKKK